MTYANILQRAISLNKLFSVVLCRF